MDFTSFAYLTFVTVVVLAFNAWHAPRFRQGVLLFANLVFLASFVRSPEQLAPLAGFLALGYAATRWVALWPKPWLLGSSVALIVVVFVVLKRYTFLPAGVDLPFLYLQVGLSYILFRILQMVIDSAGGEEQARLDPLNFFNFTCNFLSFVSGPIQRSTDFSAAEANPVRQLDSDRVFAAFSRVISGYVKVAVVSAIAQYLFFHLSETVLVIEPGLSLLKFYTMYVFSAVAYTLYLYYNFSGYMDIVIGIGWLLGQNLPENFNKPFSARSFLDFWSRWHMTLTDWFKTYVFNPLLKALATRFTSPHADPYLGVVAFFVTFLIMGVWHGTTSVFVLYGLLMGAGASVNKLWQVVITRRLGKKAYKALANNGAFIYLSRGLTLAYFALGLSCLWLNMQQLQTLTQHLGVFGVIACYLGLAAATGIAFLAWDTLTSQLTSLRLSLNGLPTGVIARNLALGLRILLIFTVASFFHKTPEFVYRAF